MDNHKHLAETVTHLYHWHHSLLTPYFFEVDKYWGLQLAVKVISKKSLVFTSIFYAFLCPFISVITILEACRHN